MKKFDISSELSKEQKHHESLGRSIMEDHLHDLDGLEDISDKILRQSVSQFKACYGLYGENGAIILSKVSLGNFQPKTMEGLKSAIEDDFDVMERFVKVCSLVNNPPVGFVFSSCKEVKLDSL